MATQLILTLSPTTTQCSIYSVPPVPGSASSRLGSVIWLSDDRYLGGYTPRGCATICKHQGPERRPIPCPAREVEAFPTAGEAIAFVVKRHGLELPCTFTLPIEFGEKGRRDWKPEPRKTGSWVPSEPVPEPTPITSAPRKRKPTAAPASTSPATIEEMVAKAHELIKEESRSD